MSSPIEIKIHTLCKEPTIYQNRIILATYDVQTHIQGHQIRHEHQHTDIENNLKK